MAQPRESLEGWYYVDYVAKEVIRDIQFPEFLETRHIFGQGLQPVAIEGETF